MSLWKVAREMLGRALSRSNEVLLASHFPQQVPALDLEAGLDRASP